MSHVKDSELEVVESHTGLDGVDGVNWKDPATWSWVVWGGIAVVAYGVYTQVFGGGGPVTGLVGGGGDPNSIFFASVDADQFKAALGPWSSKYGDMILERARAYNVNPALVYGIGDQESGWGSALSPQGPAGTGDGGHGRGLMQIDDRFPDVLHSSVAAGTWTDPYTNITQGLDILLDGYNKLMAAGYTGADLEKAAVSAYNAGVGGVLKALRAGQDSDTNTTRKDYSTEVYNRIYALYQKMNALPSP